MPSTRPIKKKKESPPPQTMDYDFDLCVIGAGSGGPRAARFAATKYGVRVACVELPFGFVSSPDVGGAGGTCVD